MACYKPLTAFQLTSGEITFAERGDIQRNLTLACGQCIGCRLERSRQWALRCLHEAKMHRANSFVTLTYREEHLPEHRQLVKRDPVLFLKRLRKATGKRFRFYMAGEYGEQYGRPHYHFCLFGLNFPDQQYLQRSPTGYRLYRSPLLEKVWPYGFNTVGELTFETAAYTARYVMKKMNGARAQQHYTRTDPETGEIYQLQPEYNNMSRMPGIGKAWLDKYATDAYPEGKVVLRGKKCNTPRYYDKEYKKLDPLGYEQLQFAREREGLLHHLDQTDERLAVREIVATAKIRTLKRKLH